jgi:hypothetical protein
MASSVSVAKVERTIGKMVGVHNVRAGPAERLELDLDEADTTVDEIIQSIDVSGFLLTAFLSCAYWYRCSFCTSCSYSNYSYSFFYHCNHCSLKNIIQFLLLKGFGIQGNASLGVRKTCRNTFAFDWNVMLILCH